MRTLIALVFVVLLIVFLNAKFPYALESNDQKVHVLYLVLLLALVGSGVLHAREQPLGQVAKAALAWMGVFVVLILGYSYRDVLLDNRLGAELMPYRARTTDDGAITVRGSADGHFFLEMEANNVPVKFMVDTGATNIVLSPRDAQRIGIDTETLNYNRRAMTANGMVKGAVIRISSLRVRHIELADVAVTVNGASMDISLLGMDFLKALRSYRVEGNTLTLVP
ncbi:MAG: TIGR02281 family clan AA aspartic protease [Alphaproteobacteria bacterium]